MLDKLRLRSTESKDFKGVDVLFIQHFLGSFIPRLSAMRANGLDPDRSWFIDIPYSTNRVVLQWIRNFAPEGHVPEVFDDPLAPYSDRQLERVIDMLRRIANRKDPRPLLVVDDGAYFVRALKHLRPLEPEFVEMFREASVVEQTTRGLRYLMDCGAQLINDLRLTVVSIARCRTKRLFEAPFIGAVVSRSILRTVEAAGGDWSRIKRVAILGFGPVGRATMNALRERIKFAIDVVEPDEAKHAEIEKLGGTPMLDLPEALPKDRMYDLVVGCTGYNSFKLHQRSLLAKEAFLASGSSAALEFNRAGFVELASSEEEKGIKVLDREETIAQGIHAPIRMEIENHGRFVFLNA
ncbi:MAG: hypothetical protein O6952_08905, partial [Planctomycetota bacterium]|nr:hypothetical protein [Planctomycetota bacterium]